MQFLPSLVHGCVLQFLTKQRVQLLSADDCTASLQGQSSFSEWQTPSYSGTLCRLSLKHNMLQHCAKSLTEFATAPLHSLLGLS